MEITVNNEVRHIEDEKLLSLITSVLGEKTAGIAVAVNESIVQRSHWHATALKEKDRVLIIKATQGG